MPWRIAGIILPVFAAAGIGWLYARWKRPDLAPLNQINMDVLAPLLVFWAIEPSRLTRQKKNRHVMTDAAGQHEQMPDAVKMSDLLVKHIENQANGIKQAARQQPDEAFPWQGLQQRFERHQHQPAHQHINHQ